MLGRLVKSVLGESEASVAGSLLGDADGIIDIISLGANVNAGDGTPVATVDGATLAISYPEHMQHASATVLPKLSYFLSAINASHHKVSVPMYLQLTPLNTGSELPDFQLASSMQSVGRGLVVLDMIGLSDGNTAG